MLSQRLPDITRFSASSRHFPVNDRRPANPAALRPHSPPGTPHMLYM